MKKVVIGIVIVVAIALVAGFVPLIEVPYTITVTCYEDEPYEAIETYSETQLLVYEVVESYTETDSYKVRYQIVIGGIVFQDEIVDVFYPVGYVTLQNKDSVSGTFGVQFTFYALEKLQAGMYGHPDFNFTDYLAGEDPDSYLDKLDWGKLDWDEVMIFCDVYDEQESLILEPDEAGTAMTAISDIDIDKHVWKWVYTITEPTKTVEKERIVTKYRQVERERTETHYKKVPIFEYLFSRF